MLKAKFSCAMAVIFTVYLLGKEQFFPSVQAGEDLMYNGETFVSYSNHTLTHGTIHYYS
jgi:hypothetical protein